MGTCVSDNDVRKMFCLLKRHSHPVSYL